MKVVGRFEPATVGSVAERVNTKPLSLTLELSAQLSILSNSSLSHCIPIQTVNCFIVPEISV